MDTPRAAQICGEIGGYIHCDRCPLLVVCDSDFDTVEEWENAIEEAATVYINNKKSAEKVLKMTAKDSV